MSAAREFALDPIERPRGPDWAQAMALYREAFPAAEREPEAQLARRLEAGRYRLVLARPHGAAQRDPAPGLGFTLLDRVPEHDYAVLTYLAVARAQRGRGIGGALAGEVVDSFRRRRRESWLLVEARQPGLVELYRARGFSPLALDYRVPAFDGPGEHPMTLLLHGLAEVSEVSGEVLASMIRHMFVAGYGLRERDPRLRAQLARIPAHYAMATATPLPCCRGPAPSP